MRRIEIIGNLGKDAELKVVGQNNTDVLNFSVAAKGGKKDSESTWFSCALFGARAAKLAEYLKKGQRVFVRGEVTVRKWEAAGGKSGVDMDVNVDELELIGDKKEAREEPSGGGTGW